MDASDSVKVARLTPDTVVPDATNDSQDTARLLHSVGQAPQRIACPTDPPGPPAP